MKKMGFIKKYLITYALKILIDNISPFLRMQLVKLVLDREKKAEETITEFDDAFILILKKLLNID